MHMKTSRRLRRRTLTAIGIIELLSVVWANEPPPVALGESIDPHSPHVLDLSVMPDGEGLPAGEGTAAQGKRVYETACLRCHGPAGSGGSADALAGAEQPLDSEWPDKTVGNYWPYATTLFDFIRRAMPMDQPGSLSDSDTYALVAYLLRLNGIIEEDAVMNRRTLPKVIMPNRDGFVPAMD